MRIAFLFGAGISQPAGMPKTQHITEQVLTGTGFTRHTDGRYIQHSPLIQHNEYIPRVLEFLKHLKVEIDQYYRPDQTGRHTNYEDLYYMASQIYDSEFWEYDNPAVQPLIDKISAKIKPILCRKNGDVKETWILCDLAGETINYIADSVWGILSEKPSKYEHLLCIKEACQDNSLSSVDIFTLNHDAILERYLSQNSIKVTDGFGEPIKKVRYWNPSLFEEESSNIKFFKLHGSIDWFRLVAGQGNSYTERIGLITEGIDIWDTKSPEDLTQLPIDGRPLLLIGTHNKVLQYLRGMFTNLHYWLFRSLNDSQNLVISGYGVGDKGINTRIIEWVYSSSNHRIILIHPNEEEIKNTARGAIGNKWETWKSREILTIIPCGIEQVEWKKIKENLTLENK